METARYFPYSSGYGFSKPRAYKSVNSSETVTLSPNLNAKHDYLVSLEKYDIQTGFEIHNWVAERDDIEILSSNNSNGLRSICVNATHIAVEGLKDDFDCVGNYEMVQELIS